MSEDIRDDGAPAPNHPVGHNPSYEEPDRIETVEKDSGAGRTVALLAGGLLIAGLAIVFATVGFFDGPEHDLVAQTSVAKRELAASGVLQSNPQVAPTDGKAVVVDQAGDAGAAVITPNGDGGTPEIVTVPNQVKPKLAVEGGADYVKTQDGLKTVQEGTGQVKPLNSD